jgi:hypothetical protein
LNVSALKCQVTCSTKIELLYFFRSFAKQCVKKYFWNSCWRKHRLQSSFPIGGYTYTVTAKIGNLLLAMQRRVGDLWPSASNPWLTRASPSTVCGDKLQSGSNRTRMSIRPR